VIAGIGVDAMIMDETDPKLKAKVGTAAYVFAAAKALGRLPVHMTIQLDDQRPFRRHAMMCAVGNVGDLPGNITLIPGARPDDGMLDVFIASPHRVPHWIKVVLRVITRRPRKDDQVDQHTARKVRITLDELDTYQLDGDAIGECRSMLAEVQPEALSVCLPADGTS
jgi:diacylglycerol kinase (ATP)